MLTTIELTKIYEKLDKHIDDMDVLILGISGGSDSMSMYHIIKDYLKFKSRPNHIIIAHFNHNFRKESYQEAVYLKEYFKDEHFFSEIYKGNNFSESSLRQARFDFFSEILKQTQTNGNHCKLLLGHNLNDRIETAFLNMMRGCDIEGFLNMNFFSRKDHGGVIIDVLRPLISISKIDIDNYCNENGIHFFIDHTNFDENVSLRNLVRNKIVGNFVENSNIENDGDIAFFRSFKKIFDSFEQVICGEKNDNPRLEKILTSKFWDAQFSYKIIGKITKIKHIVAIFKELGIYNDIYQSSLDEFMKFFVSMKSGIKYINGINFVISHNVIYVVKSREGFFNKSIEQIVQIDRLGEYEIGDFKISISEKSYLGGELRFMRDFDKIGSKTLSKYMINNKIPLIWRHYIPLVSKDGNILHVYDDKVKLFI